MIVTHSLDTYFNLDDIINKINHFLETNNHKENKIILETLVPTHTLKMPFAICEYFKVPYTKSEGETIWEKVWDIEQEIVLGLNTLTKNGKFSLEVIHTNYCLVFKK